MAQCNSIDPDKLSNMLCRDVFSKFAVKGKLPPESENEYGVNVFYDQDSSKKGHILFTFVTKDDKKVQIDFNVTEYIQDARYLDCVVCDLVNMIGKPTEEIQTTDMRESEDSDIIVQYAPSGVASQNKPKELAKEAKKQISLQIKAHLKDTVPDELDAFYESISSAVEGYHANKEIEDSSKPGKVRGNLNNALDAVYALNDAVNNLDANSYYLIRKTTKGGVSGIQDKLNEIMFSLSEASHLADKLPRNGALRDFKKLYFAADVRDAIRKHLGVKPTSTKDSLFPSLLELTLPLVIGREAKATHELARNALKVIRNVQSPGLIEYIPPENTK